MLFNCHATKPRVPHFNLCAADNNLYNAIDAAASANPGEHLMKTTFLSRAPIFTLLAIGFLHANPASADITYSWAGHLSLRDAGPDPWLIGPDGAEFKLQTTVSGAAVEQYSPQVPFAGFPALSARLWIDGEEVEYVGDGFIDFSDLENIADVVVAVGLFRKFGQTVDISTGVELDPSTFAFHLPFELPPYFPTTQTLGRGGAGGSQYYTLVPAGTLVEVVPEPATVPLALFSFALIPHRRRNKNRR